MRSWRLWIIFYEVIIISYYMFYYLITNSCY
nr:MAG TPA: hypothetical protein [Bacteriophage sp.]